MIPVDTSTAILGTGSCVPDRVVTNAELEGLVSGFDPASGDFSVWVDRVTHIQERRWADRENEDAGTLGKVAAERALEASGLAPQDIDQVLFCSFTVREMFSGDHVKLVHDLGMNVGACMIGAACSGSLFGLTLGRTLVQAGQCKNVLVVGVECMSHVLNMDDPITAIIFGDSAGAVVIGRKDNGEETGFRGPSVLRSEYVQHAIHMMNMNCPRDADIDENGRVQRQYLSMAGGPRVLKRAINRMALAVVEALGFKGDDLKSGNPELRALLDRVKVIPHQANGRILDGLQAKLGMPYDNLYRTIYKYANASAATNLLTLDYAVREGNMRREPPADGSGLMGTIHEGGPKIEKGDLVVVASIGAGYLYGATAFVQAY